MHRRTLLSTAAAGLAAGAAGCLGSLETQSARAPPVPEDRPDAVYFPSHVEGMLMAGGNPTGDFRVAVTYAYPHRFWNITGSTVEKTAIASGDDVHLMASVWDPETGTVIPETGVSVAIGPAGEPPSEEVIYPMLSQRMGVHYGANFSLSGAGDYEVTVNVGGLPDAVRTYGAFDGKFREPSAATVPFRFERSQLESLPYESTPDRAGTRAAADPMQMEMMPVGYAPAADALPGRLLGQPTSADAVLATVAVDDADRFGAGTDESYLAVSARTPYNRMMIPAMAMEATLVRDGETLFEGSLARGIDPDLRYHYGATVPTPEPGDELTLAVTTPPQVARHEGYETAFLEFSPVSLTL